MAPGEVVRVALVLHFAVVAHWPSGEPATQGLRDQHGEIDVAHLFRDVAQCLVGHGGSCEIGVPQGRGGMIPAPQAGPARDCRPRTTVVQITTRCRGSAPRTSVRSTLRSSVTNTPPRRTAVASR